MFKTELDVANCRPKLSQKKNLLRDNQIQALYYGHNSHISYCYHQHLCKHSGHPFQENTLCTVRQS